MNNDCIYHIFTKLDVNDIINCSLVSKRFYKISNIEILWYLLFKKKFYNVKCTVINGRKFYGNFKKYSILNNFLLKNGQGNVNIITRNLIIIFKQLQTIPKELGQLASLQILYLYNNQLQSIPKELGQLASLQMFNLHGNKLQSIPKELGQLAILQMFYLHGNKLQSIPKELGQLAMLHKFILDNKLKNLIKLDNGNKISYVL